MRKLNAGLTVSLLILVLARGAAASELRGEGIGARIADARLVDTAGKTYELESYSGHLVVLVFWAFKCPVALAYDDRVRALQDKYRAQGVVVLGVDSSQNEAPDEIRLNVANLKLSFPILIDEQGALAERLGVTHVPSAVVLDSGSMVRYQGAIDNNKKPGEGGRVAYVEQALDSLLAGGSVSNSETRPFGCNIRRKNV